MQSELTDDALAGPFRLLQRRRGQRYSLDDTLTARAAVEARPEAQSGLDLGSGIGSVLLMLAYKLPEARLWGVEAQSESFALLTRNCVRNGVSGRTRISLGDLRDAALLARVRRELAAKTGRCGFELVTGTPPYQPLGQGSVSPDPQRAHARVELRGGVEAYLLAAAHVLAENGVFVVCADARAPERVSAGAAAAGLRVVARQAVVPAPHKPALFAVYSLVRATHPSASSGCEERPAFVARDGGGQRTQEALALRRFFDLDTKAYEAPSPRLRTRAQVAKPA